MCQMSEEFDFTYKAQSINNRRGCTKTRDCVTVFLMAYYRVSHKFIYKLWKRWTMFILFVQMVLWLVKELLVNLKNADDSVLVYSYLHRQTSGNFCRTPRYRYLHLCWRIFICFRLWRTDLLASATEPVLLTFLIHFTTLNGFSDMGSVRCIQDMCFMASMGDGRAKIVLEHRHHCYLVRKLNSTSCPF